MAKWVVSHSLLSEPIVTDGISRMDAIANAGFTVWSAQEWIDARLQLEAEDAQRVSDGLQPLFARSVLLSDAVMDRLKAEKS